MSYLDLMNKNKTQKRDTSGPVVFVASDITMIFKDNYSSDSQTIVRDGKCYRRLTPEYWAWFNYKYGVMEEALRRGKISEDTFVQILERISKLYLHALDSFDRETLKHAERTFDPRKWNEKIKKQNSEATGTPSRYKKSVPRLVVSPGRTERYEI